MLTGWIQANNSPGLFYQSFAIFFFFFFLLFFCVCGPSYRLLLLFADGWLLLLLPPPASQLRREAWRLPLEILLRMWLKSLFDLSGAFALHLLSLIACARNPPASSSMETNWRHTQHLKEERGRESRRNRKDKSRPQHVRTNSEYMFIWLIYFARLKGFGRTGFSMGFQSLLRLHPCRRFPFFLFSLRRKRSEGEKRGTTKNTVVANCECQPAPVCSSPYLHVCYMRDDNHSEFCECRSTYMKVMDGHAASASRSETVARRAD